MNRPIIYEIAELEYSNRTKRKVPLEYYIVPHRNKKQILYFPLKGLVSLVNQSFVDKINTDDPVVRALFDRVEKQTAVAVIERSENTNRLTLALTTACDLKCVYCYAKGGDKPDYMSWETAKAAIDHRLNRNTYTSFRLEFHGGGEQLLAFDMMKKCYDYTKKKCTEKGIPLQTHCTTNGTLLDEAKIKWFKKINTHIILSFDGLPEVQNKQRPFRDGSPSYPALKKTIKLLNKHEIAYNIVCGITQKSVSKMGDMMKHMHTLNVRECKFNPIGEWGRCPETGTPAAAHLEFNNGIKNANEVDKQYKKRIIDDVYYTENPRGIYKDRCEAMGHTSFVVTTQGYITQCITVLDPLEPISKEFFYGKIENGKVDIDQKKVDSLRNRTVNNMEPCKTCFAKYMCCGACLAETARETGSIFKPSEKICLKKKQLATEFLTSLFDE